MTQQRMRPCPTSPNCVSSLALPSDSVHFIPALQPPPGEDPMALFLRAAGLIAKWPRAHIEVQEDGYLHATSTSRLFRWVDDLELQLDIEAGLLQVRSAARSGYGDLGVNRKRVEALRAALGAS